MTIYYYLPSFVVIYYDGLFPDWASCLKYNPVRVWMIHIIYLDLPQWRNNKTVGTLAANQPQECANPRKSAIWIKRNISCVFRMNHVLRAETNRYPLNTLQCTASYENFRTLTTCHMLIYVDEFLYLHRYTCDYLAFYLAFYLTFYLAIFLAFFQLAVYLAFYLAYVLAFDLALYLAGILSCILSGILSGGWGAAVPTAIRSWRGGQLARRGRRE